MNDPKPQNANAGPLPGDHPIDRLVSSYPPKPLVDALERIALNIFGDTTPQVLAGEALDEYQAAMAKNTAADPQIAHLEGQAKPADVNDLAALVRQLTYALSRTDPNNALAGRAISYLRRTGLLGSPLRAEAEGGSQNDTASQVRSSDAAALKPGSPNPSAGAAG
jgi:hypothetical protein